MGFGRKFGTGLEVIGMVCLGESYVKNNGEFEYKEKLSGKNEQNKEGEGEKGKKGWKMVFLT
jgi:hypothetical protein